MGNRENTFLTWAKRLLVYCFGLFIMAVGVVFSVKSALGVSPVTCLANVVYQIMLDRNITAMTLGVCTTVVYCLYILVEILILRRDFKPDMLLQIVASFFFGFLVTCASGLFGFLPAPETYPMRLLFLLCSIPLVAVGVMCYLAPQILPTPGEGMSLAISKKTGLTVGSAKMVFDCCCVAISAAVSLIYFHRLVGVREGTVICALTIGFVMKQIMKVCEKPLMAFVERETKLQQAMGDESYLLDATGRPKLLISVSWEFGSGGYEIAKELAEKLGIAFYGNDQLIPLEAAESGLSQDFIHRHEHNMSGPLAHDFLTSGYTSVMELSPLEQLFAAQTRVLRRIAAGDESALIVGRCSDYILYNDPNNFRVFIHAPTDYRVAKKAEEDGISQAEARAELQTTDTSRANHYAHFTGREWGNTKYYNLAVDTKTFGKEGSLKIIENAVRTWAAERELEIKSA